MFGENQLNDETYIRNQIRKMLLEQEEKKPKKKKKKGTVRARVGKGNWKFAVKEAGALATQNPGELMSRLGVQPSSSPTTEERVYDIVSSAISGNEIMSQAYDGATINETGDGTVVMVYPGGITSRDATKYMEHTLIGAKGAGYIEIDKDVNVINSGGSVKIEFS
jgi:hypothetical protein